MMLDQDAEHGPDQYGTRLKADYEQTLATWRMLVDLRFRLLAFVPTISGVLVALAARSPSATSALVALFGLTALFGIIMYDLRNTQFHDAVIHRAKELEKALSLTLVSDKGTGYGGLMNERPRNRYRLAGVSVWHDRALYIVYASSAAGLAAIGILGVLAQFRLPDGWRWLVTTAVAIALFTAVLVALHRFGSQVVQPKRKHH